MQCKDCRGRIGLPATGNCKNCGCMIGRRSDALCDKCSSDLKECKSCRKPLTDADSAE